MSYPLIASDWSQEKPDKTKIKPCQPVALLTPATINLCHYNPCHYNPCHNTMIGFISVLFGFRWFLIRSMQVYWSQQKPSKTKIKPCQPLALLTLLLLTLATITPLPQHCDRFYLGFIRFSLISYPLIASDWSQEKPDKTKIKPCQPLALLTPATICLIQKLFLYLIQRLWLGKTLIIFVFLAKAN